MPLWGDTDTDAGIPKFIGRGQVVAVIVSQPGSGYTVAPTVTFAAPPAGGITATGTATINASGEVTGVAITDPGEGYTTASPPTATFSAAPSGGVTASALVAFKEYNRVYDQATDAYLFLSIDQAALTANRSKGMKTPGWFRYRSYVDGAGETRYKIEPLVAMNKTEAYAGKNPNNTQVTG